MNRRWSLAVALFLGWGSLPIAGGDETKTQDPRPKTQALRGSPPIASGDEAASLRLIPFPMRVQIEPGQFVLKGPLVLAHSALGDSMVAAIVDEFRCAGLQPPQTRRMDLRMDAVDSPFPAFRLAKPSVFEGHDGFDGVGLWFTAPNGYYSLEVRPHGIGGGAHTEEGLRYAAQTLIQLVRANRRGDALPCLTIHDAPALRWRGFQDDMTRGPSSKLETLKFEAALGAYLKMNLMSYYMEHQFAFKEHPEIGPKDGSLTPEDLRALVAFAKPLGIDILGNQQSFGHFGNILKHPQYAGLRETADILCPVREESYQLLDDMYCEACAVLPFPFFNVCCDETFGLGDGPSKELVRKIGVGGVYVRHVRRIHDLLAQKHGKRMMMWGDIILQHPKDLEEIPKDTIMLTWAYDPRELREPDCPIRALGLRVFRVSGCVRLEPHPARLLQRDDQYPKLRPRWRQAPRDGYAQHRLAGRRRGPQGRQMAR